MKYFLAINLFPANITLQLANEFVLITETDFSLHPFTSFYVPFMFSRSRGYCDVSLNAKSSFM